MQIGTITAKGQITMNKDIMGHLGVQSGDRILFKKLSNGTVVIEPEKDLYPIESLFGILGKARVHLTDAEMKTAIEEAHAEAGMKGLTQ
jgi:bifunctional DNA-binding transcriptional regulator/antitoxin component of YhaV-PrlF toxin-antitoxin module